MNHVCLSSGRILLGLYFLIPGLAKFAAWDMHIDLMESHNIPFATVLLPVAAIIQLMASSAIILNRSVGIAAFVLAIMVIFINVGMHDFWNYEGLVGQHETQNFVKNLAIMGGLLVLCAQNNGLKPLMNLFNRND